MSGEPMQIKNDFLQDVAEGKVPGYSIVHKFGAGDLTTSLTPISQGNSYKTPTAATELEFVSGSDNDQAGGSGAQEITVIGLDANWEESIETFETNGTTPVVLGEELTRLYRWYVSRSGTYASQTAGSHSGTLTLRESGGGDIWSTIITTPFAIGQSQIGVYTIPAGKTGYLLSKHIFTDTSKTADIYFYQRPNADDVSTPFSGTMRLVEREVGVTGGYELTTKTPKGPFVGPCDIGFMGKVSTGTAECSVEFELLIKDS